MPGDVAHFLIRPGDPDPDAGKLPRAEMFDHRRQAFVPACPSGRLHPDRSEGQIRVIRDDHHPVRRNPVETTEGANRFTAQVHIGPRLADNDLPSTHPSRRDF